MPDEQRILRRRIFGATVVSEQGANGWYHRVTSGPAAGEYHTLGETIAAIRSADQSTGAKVAASEHDEE
jgi:hypothetical protein